MNATNQPSTADSDWPKSAMLMWGIFSTRTPAGRRYVRQCVMALAILTLPSLFFLVQIPFHFHYLTPRTFGRATTALLPLGFSYIAWAFRKYLQSLDELARRLQIEAMAWTYLTGFVLMALLTAIWLESVGKINLAWFCPIWFSLLEPVRAGWLYVLTRRY